MPRQTLAQRWWRSRVGYPFLVEAAFMVGLFFVYKVIRFAVHGDAREAFRNARSVIGFERATWLFSEPDFQRHLLHHPEVVRLLNRYYIGMHFPTTIAVLAWLYIWHARAYVAARRILVVLTATGMVVHVLYPLAPPRMFPDLGFVDTGALFGPAAYGRGAMFDGLANQFAAMPSLHFGWAVVIAIAVIRNARSRWRWLIVVHPLATTAAIVGTANHYWMDAIVAALLLAAVYAVVGALSRLRGRRDARRDAQRDAGGPTDPIARQPKSAAGDPADVVIDLRDPAPVAAPQG